MPSLVVATPRWAGAVAAATLATTLAACGGGSERAPVGHQVQPQGLYASAQYSQDQIDPRLDQTYSTRTNTGGNQATYVRSADNSDEYCEGGESDAGASELVLKMDVYVPPNASAATPQPLLISVHGGGFTCGSKESMSDDAMSYAQAGYVAATINYRLTPDNHTSEELRLMAQSQAVEDVQNAVRYLRTNAARYGIDPDRVALLGSSAGGGAVLISGVDEDDGVTGAGRPGVMGSDYQGVSAWAQGVVSTGATLIDVEFPQTVDELHFDSGGSPTLLLHAQPQDPITGATWDGNVVPTWQRIVNGGVSCDLVATPPSMHTVSMVVGADYWPEIHDFLRSSLNLP